MPEDVIPDYGILLNSKFGKSNKHHFYSVRLSEILYVGESLYSFSVDYFLAEIKYMASFDFSKERLEEILSSIEVIEFREYLESNLLKPFIGPERVDFSGVSIEVDITAHLGELVKVELEEFIPLVVDEFKNIKLLI